MSPVCECIRDVLRKTYPGIPFRVRAQRPRSRQPGCHVIMLQVPADREEIARDVVKMLIRYTEGISVALKGEETGKPKASESKIYYPACKKYINVELDEIIVSTY